MSLVELAQKHNISIHRDLVKTKEDLPYCLIFCNDTSLMYLPIIIVEIMKFETEQDGRPCYIQVRQEHQGHMSVIDYLDTRPTRYVFTAPLLSHFGVLPEDLETLDKILDTEATYVASVNDERYHIYIPKQTE